METKLKFSIVFHPQTDRQTQVVNRTLENLLKCLVRENLKTWDLILRMAEFAYTSSVDELSPSKQQRNTKSKTRQRKRKRRRSTTSKKLPYNQGTQDLTWFGNVPTSTGRGEIFIEENTRVTMRSLSQLSMMNF